MKLAPGAEEVATMFAIMKETDYAKKKIFRDNFWADWSKILGKSHAIKSLDGCDFGLIYDHLMQQREMKKALDKDQKKAT